MLLCGNAGSSQESRRCSGVRWLHLPLALLHHQVGEHEARLLVARLVPHERGALRLRLLELAAGNVEPRHRQQRLLVRLLLLERLLHNHN